MANGNGCAVTVTRDHFRQRFLLHKRGLGLSERRLGNTYGRCFKACEPQRFREVITTSDIWLSNEIQKIMNSAAYKNGGVIFITWDEGENDSDGPIGMIVLSPFAKGGGYASNVRYTHSSTLLTLEKIFGLSVRLGGSAQATDLSDLFKSPF